MRLGIKILITAILPSFATDAFTKECPALPPPPNLSVKEQALAKTWKSVAAPHLARYAVNQHEEPNYGIGYLRVAAANQYYYDWPRVIRLPLWHKADEDAFHGWLLNGRIYPTANAPPYDLTGTGLVETEYEHSNFIVWKITDSGWLQISVRAGQNGKFWTHQCHLEIGEAKLQYQDWRSFLQQHADWLHFRAQVPHSLRELPDAHSKRVTLIGLDHKLMLLDIKGDWMRVKVQQPDTTCLGNMKSEFAVSEHTGWVKWRDDIKGPWVWVYTRGC